jgi:hypothetical protein
MTYNKLYIQLYFTFIHKNYKNCNMILHQC